MGTIPVKLVKLEGVTFSSQLLLATDPPVCTANKEGVVLKKLLRSLLYFDI